MKFTLRGSAGLIPTLDIGFGCGSGAFPLQRNSTSVVVKFGMRSSVATRERNRTP